MSVRIKFGDCIPFPDKPGMWLRFVTTDSPTKEQSIVITQGNVMLFDGDEITLMDQMQKTTTAVVSDGDKMCLANGMLVSYLPIIGIGITKKQGVNGTTRLKSSQGE